MEMFIACFVTSVVMISVIFKHVNAMTYKPQSRLIIKLIVGIVCFMIPISMVWLIDKLRGV